MYHLSVLTLLAANKIRKWKISIMNMNSLVNNDQDKLKNIFFFFRGENYILKLANDNIILN